MAHHESVGAQHRGRGSAIEKVARDRQIVADRLSGLPWSAISERHGLQERQLRNIFNAWQKDGAAELAAEDPAELVYEFLERYRRVEEDLAQAAEEADNSAARVGALRMRVEAIDRQVQLMQASGHLPRELGQLRVSADIESVAARIVAVFHDHDVPEAATRAVIEALAEESS